MVTDFLEVRVKVLEETIQEYTKKIQRLDDIQEIQNLMGRYVFYQEAQVPGFPEDFYATKTPGVSGEVAHLGVYLGMDGIKRLNPYNIKPGSSYQHLLTTPVIEVAGDGKTAKGVWISCGQDTIPHKDTGTITAYWIWTKYGCDFIKEDGKWKLWHYHVYRVFRTPFDKSWVEEHELKTELPEKHPDTPDLPTTYDNPYSKEYIAQLVPKPPDPYETFSETFTYGPPEKK